VLTVDRRVLEPEEIRRALTRVAHEIVERNGGTDDIVLVGIRSRGEVVHVRLADNDGADEVVIGHGDDALDLP
jgi:pyrimidine operon attenuation protein/uracil phosphoribosyltransferase